MQQQKLNFEELIDLLAHRAERGIIDGEAVVECVLNNLLPRYINDTRGLLRLAVERDEDGDYHVKEFTCDKSRAAYISGLA